MYWFDTWKNVLVVGIVRVNPPVLLLYDTLEHGGEFRECLSSLRKRSEESPERVVSFRSQAVFVLIAARRRREVFTRAPITRSRALSRLRSADESRVRQSLTF